VIAGDRPTPEVTVYGRPGCHLCDEALAVLRRLRAEAGFALHTVDIEDDPQLLRAYLERIPVIALDGLVLYDFHVDEADLRSRLARVARR
jgi:glutaredoxin